MGRQSELALQSEIDSKGYSEDSKSDSGECKVCKTGKITRHKDETPGFKDVWYTCSTPGCNGK